MAGFFWTTTEDRGDSLTITEGGHYEALERRGDTPPKRASIKRSGDIIPSSDVPELCVSASASASLFAKVQGASTTGTYYIYRTEVRPDTDATRAGLDFAELEEFRYTMDGEQTVPFDEYATVDVPQQAVKDVELVYEQAERYRANTQLASAVKEALGGLVAEGTYRRGPIKEALAAQFEDFADAYGFEQAERLFGSVPSGVDRSKYDR